MAFENQFVVSSFNLPSRPDADAPARLVSVSDPTHVIVAMIPSRFHPLLEAARAEAAQSRFVFTFERAEDAGAQRVVIDAIRVDMDENESPVATKVGCWFCQNEPFDFTTGQWAPVLHKIFVRNATTAVRGLVSTRCTQVLQQGRLMPADHALFQFDGVTDFRESDADLFQAEVEPQRWLYRATLPDVWRKSGWDQRSGRLPMCPPGSDRELNIRRLQESFIASCLAAFNAFRQSPSASGTPHSRYFMGNTGSKAKKNENCTLDREGESHMDRVLRNLMEDCSGDGHPLTVSFQQARSLRNAERVGPERELPFAIVPKKAGSFDVMKEYVIRIRGNELSDLSLSADALVQTRGFDPRTYDFSHWTPYFQELYDEAERLGPAAFRRNHQNGLIFGDHRRPSHATQVCGKELSVRDDKRDFVSFQELWQRTEAPALQDVSRDRDDTTAIEHHLAALQLKHDE